MWARRRAVEARKRRTQKCVRADLSGFRQSGKKRGKRPIYATSTFAQEAPGVHKGLDYGRSHNPTRFAFERAVAVLEGGTAGFAFSSGLAAIATILDLLETGSHNRADLAERIGFLQNAVGAILGPFDSFLAHRGLKTLGLRAQRHSENALELAEWLEQHPSVEKVIYPGLSSHPQYALARKQQQGLGGGIITAIIKGGLETSSKVLSRTRFFTLAESLGGVEGLIEHPAIMTHASIPSEIRKKNGIEDGLIRISVGIEDVADLRADLDQALKF